MPSRNIVKLYTDDSYYHVYSRGVAKQKIFHDEHDYSFFISLLKRYLSDTPQKSRRHGEYPYYGSRLKLLAYCLMSNHIHMLFYQEDKHAMPECMRAILTSYSLYFNRRYTRVGPVFQSRYLASLIDRDNYLQHISRYIHLNPKQWRTYPYSSIRYYLQTKSPGWIHTKLLLNDMSISEYQKFLKDYEGHKKMLDEIKWDLANSN